MSISKLETDPALLLYKCRQSLERYSHHLVIGNLLSTRKYEVVFVDRSGEEWIKLASQEAGAIVEGEEEEIESIIIPQCIKRHGELMIRRSAAKEQLGKQSA